MHATRSLLRAALVGALLTPLAACGDDPVEPEPQRYALEVVNHHPHTMVVSYDDGSVHELGPVDPSSRHTFTIIDPAKVMVMVMARNEAQTHMVHEMVTLQADKTVVFEIKMEMDGGHGG